MYSSPGGKEGQISFFATAWKLNNRLESFLRMPTSNQRDRYSSEKAWPRLTFTSAITREALDGSVAEAQSVGFLKGKFDLGRLLAIPK